LILKLRLLFATISPLFHPIHMRHPPEYSPGVYVYRQPSNRCLSLHPRKTAVMLSAAFARDSATCRLPRWCMGRSCPRSGTHRLSSPPLYGFGTQQDVETVFTIARTSR
jgi:hypothetical protein